MDSSCAYAYTLSGHEYIDEDVDQAKMYFQSALRVDPRHFNAWYVDMVIERTESRMLITRQQVWAGLLLHEISEATAGRVPLPESEFDTSSERSAVGMRWSRELLSLSTESSMVA